MFSISVDWWHRVSDRVGEIAWVGEWVGEFVSECMKEQMKSIFQIGLPSIDVVIANSLRRRLIFPFWSTLYAEHRDVERVLMHKLSNPQAYFLLRHFPHQTWKYLFCDCIDVVMTFQTIASRVPFVRIFLAIVSYSFDSSMDIFEDLQTFTRMFWESGNIIPWVFRIKNKSPSIRVSSIPPLLRRKD